MISEEFIERVDKLQIYMFNRIRAFKLSCTTMKDLTVSTSDYLEYSRNIVGQLNAQAVPAMQPNTYVELDNHHSWLSVFNSQLNNIAAKVSRTYQRTLRKYLSKQKLLN